MLHLFRNLLQEITQFITTGLLCQITCDNQWKKYVNTDMLSVDDSDVAVLKDREKEMEKTFLYLSLKAFCMKLNIFISREMSYFKLFRSIEFSMYFYI